MLRHENELLKQKLAEAGIEKPELKNDSPGSE